MSPDLDRFLSVLRHEGRPGPVPFIELFADQPIMEAVLGRPMAPSGLQDRQAMRAYGDSLIEFYSRLGYDYVPVGVGVGFQRATAETADTAGLSRGTRHWDNSTTGLIKSWADFEAYPWPKPEAVDYSWPAYMLSRLPEGMDAMAMGSGGVLEWVMWLMSYEHFALALYDQPDLIEAMFSKVTEILVTACRDTLDMGGFCAYFVGDDMGHFSGTMISPALMRRYVFPNQRQLADITHAHGVPFLLHACGNLSEVMEDLINDVHIDAKHSFEDRSSRWRAYMRSTASGSRFWGEWM